METISQSNINTDLYSKYNTLDNGKNLQENTNTFRNPLQKIDSKNLSSNPTPASSFLLASGGLDFALKALKRNIEALQKEKQTLKLKNGNLELELSQSSEQKKILEAEILDLTKKNSIYETSIQDLKAKVQSLLDGGSLGNQTITSDSISDSLSAPTPAPTPTPDPKPASTPILDPTPTVSQPLAINPFTPLNPPVMNPNPPANPPTDSQAKDTSKVANPNEVLHDVANFLNFDEPTEQLNTLLEQDLGTKEPAIKTKLPEILDSDGSSLNPADHMVNFDDVINKQAQNNISIEDHEEFNNFLSKNNTPPPPPPQPKDFVINNNIPNISNPVPTPMTPPSVSNIIDQKNYNNINQISNSLSANMENNSNMNPATPTIPQPVQIPTPNTNPSMSNPSMSNPSMSNPSMNNPSMNNPSINNKKNIPNLDLMLNK